jgi:prolyl-tRNA synthetase
MPDDQNCNTKSSEYYSYFMSENIDTLYDDRNCSIGKKLSDNDLIGTPIQIIIGKRDLAEGLIEVKDRILEKTEKFQIDEIKKVALEKLKS